MARPEVRRASLLIAPERAPSVKPRDAAEPRRDVGQVIRIAARDDVRPGPREDRARPANREERARPAARDERRAAPVRTAARETARPGPARTTTRAAAAPARGASGHALATQRPPRELRKDADRRRSNRD